MGPAWRGLVGVQAAQSLLCEARKYYGEQLTTAFVASNTEAYVDLVKCFMQANGLELPRDRARRLHLPEVPADFDRLVLDRLLDLFEALLTRWRRVTQDSGAKASREGARRVMQSEKFKCQKILQFSFLLDRSALIFHRHAISICRGGKAHDWSPFEEAPAEQPTLQVAATDMLLSAVAHVLLPSERGPGMLTRAECADEAALGQVLQRCGGLRHPYGRAVNQAIAEKQWPQVSRAALHEMLS